MELSPVGLNRRGVLVAGGGLATIILTAESDVDAALAATRAL